MSDSPVTSAENWDAIADGYVDWTLGHLSPYSRKVLDRAALSSDAHILDVACGPGTLTVMAAPNVGSVEAVDFAPRMVAHCRSRAADFPNVSAAVADGHALPFEDNTFDAAFSMFGLAFFSDRAKGFSELYRVLRPGGHAWVSTWVPFNESPALRHLIGAVRVLNPDMGPPVGIALDNEAQFRSELEASGFENIDVQPLLGTLHIDDVDAIWDRMTTGNLFIRAVRTQIGEELWAERAPLALQKLRETMHAGQELEQPAIIGSGRKPASS